MRFDFAVSLLRNQTERRIKSLFLQLFSFELLTFNASTPTTNFENTCFSYVTDVLAYVFLLVMST